MLFLAYLRGHIWHCVPHSILGRAESLFPHWHVRSPIDRVCPTAVTAVHVVRLLRMCFFRLRYVFFSEGNRIVFRCMQAMTNSGKVLKHFQDMSLVKLPINYPHMLCDWMNRAHEILYILQYIQPVWKELHFDDTFFIQSTHVFNFGRFYLRSRHLS